MRNSVREGLPMCHLTCRALFFQIIIGSVAQMIPFLARGKEARGRYTPLEEGFLGLLIGRRAVWEGRESCCPRSRS